MIKRISLCLGIALFSCLTIIALDFYFLGEYYAGVGFPTFTESYLVRTALIAVISLITYIAFNLLADKINSQDKLIPAKQSWKSVSFSEKAMNRGIIIVLGICLIYLVIFFLAPEYFRDMSSESKGVETIGTLFLFYSTYLFFKLGKRINKLSNLSQKKLYSSIAFLFSLVCFLIAMEEVSWMQHYFKYSTPEAFSGNGQNETNLHNYVTFKIENIYYFSGFLFFIILPFINDKTSVCEANSFISFFTPGKYIVIVSAIASAYNYDMWDMGFIQFSFFFTLLLLAHYWKKSKQGTEKILLILLIGIYIVSQISFLLKGHLVQREPAFKEYKEFFIPLSFLFYAIELGIKTKLLEKTEAGKSQEYNINPKPIA